MEDKISYIKSSDRSISINSSYLLEMLPIECLQKDAIISDLEVKEHNKIIIKVAFIYILKQIISIYFILNLLGIKFKHSKW